MPAMRRTLLVNHMIWVLTHRPALEGVPARLPILVDLHEVKKYIDGLKK